VADLNAGLYFGSRRQLKSALLLRSAAMLAWVAALGGDRVGAVIAAGDGEPAIFPPRGREAGVLPILNALVEAQPRAPGMPSPGGLKQALSSLRPLLQPGSLVLLLSDFAEVDPASAAILASATLHSDFRLLWLTDPLESGGLPGGSYRVGLPGRLWWMNGDDSRTQWHNAWQAREQKLRELAMRLNLPLSQLSTHAAVIDSMVALLKEPKWAA